MTPKPKPADFTFNGVLQQPHYDNAVRAWEKMEEVEKAADEMICEILKENGPKLIQVFLASLARQMEHANATDMKLSCHLDIKGQRYSIETKSKLKKV